MISAIILFGSFFFGILGLLFYMPLVGLFIPGATINNINMTPMFIFPVLIVIFIAFVHFISDEAMNRIERAGNILVKIAPYLVLLSLVLYIAYAIRGNDFMLFIPYYWFHNFVETFDLIFIIIQFLLAFLIGLTIFSAAGFSYDKYVDVTYESMESGREFETKRSEAYTGRFQFYLTAFLGLFIGVLISFTAFAIVAFVLYFSFVIIGKLKHKALKDKARDYKVANRFVRNQTIISVSLTLVAAIGVSIGVLVNDHRLEKPTDVMSIVLDEHNKDYYLNTYLDANIHYTHNETNYDLALVLKLFSKKSAYVVEDLQVRIELTYQKIEVETGEAQEVITYDETLSFDRVYTTTEIYEIAPYIDTYPTHTAYAAISQNITFIKGTAECRYDISKELPYRKIGTRYLESSLSVGVTYDEEDGYRCFLRSLSNIYIRELSVKKEMESGADVMLHFYDVFLLENHSIEIFDFEAQQGDTLFGYDYAKGYISSFYVN